MARKKVEEDIRTRNDNVLYVPLNKTCISVLALVPLLFFFFSSLPLNLLIDAMRLENSEPPIRKCFPESGPVTTAAAPGLPHSGSGAQVHPSSSSSSSSPHPLYEAMAHREDTTPAAPGASRLH